MSSCDDKLDAKKSTRRIYTFTEARRMARTYGFTTRQEFLDYECPGAYKVPKDPHVIWAEEWKGWDDFLGVPLGYQDGKAVARELAKRWNLQTEEDYLTLMANRGCDASAAPAPVKTNLPQISDDDLAMRLPYRPDLYYKNDGWNTWEEWLGV
eukprot:scaffold6961_cov227-Amphora_coffeaeformis.AAC.2